MRKQLSYILCILLLSGCTAERYDTQQHVGRISVALMSDVAVKSPVGLTDAQAADYNISVLDASGAPAVYAAPEDKKGMAIPTVDYKDFETVTVAWNQSYQVTAESCTVEESEEGLGCARYVGNSGLFELNASNIYEKAEIVCSQTNALVTVVFDSSVSDRFNDLKVTLESGGRVLEITESADEVETYFTPAALSYSISGSYAETSYQVNLSGDPLALEAKDNIRLIVKLDLTHGLAAMPSLTVTEEYASEVEDDCEIDPYK